ncbi:hypothetical protein [Aeromonas caviae]|uniref:hypothetical protein n=1 Tax=Aeromonas caviae TaxID=648 RepID=UPI00057B711D|nr:hypothetical protein [Aeromonas caviae]
MSTELHDTDLQAAIDRENAKPDALQRNQELIQWAQAQLDDRKNPGAARARDAFMAMQNAKGIGNEKDPLPQMTKYLQSCIARCRPRDYQGRH